MDNQTFHYTYSAEQQQEIRDIRQKYLPPETNKMEQLRRLDAGVSPRAFADGGRCGGCLPGDVGSCSKVRG